MVGVTVVGGMWSVAGRWFCTTPINSCSHCTGATFATEQKTIRYSVNEHSLCSHCTG